jgi:L-2-amino-thiazoline-4-carboxylic acid hydrolase
MNVPLIERARIQAQLLVPLVKALRDELGAERADALVRRALGDLYRRFGEEFWRSRTGEDLGQNVSSAFNTFARGDALEYRVLEQSRDAYEINVNRCRYAEFFKELREPELGFLLVCGADFQFAEGFGADVKLTRTQTIMQGAGHCDFRFRRSESAK